MKKLLFISLAIVLTLSVGLIGCGGGGVEYDLTVAATEGGSTTPSVGTHTYAEGTVVNLVATSDTYYGFVNWTGDVSTVANVTDPTTTITMSGDYNITANFVVVQPWNFNIQLAFQSTAGQQTSIWKSVWQNWIWAVQNATGVDGGNFTFNVGWGEGLYKPEDSLDAISLGWTDVGQLSGDTFTLGGIGYLPFLFNMTSQAYALHTLLQTEVETWDAGGELDDVRILLSAPLQPAQWFGTDAYPNCNVTHLGNFSSPTKLKVRAEAGEVATIQAFNATPYTIGTSELVGALSADLVNGCFFTYSGALAFGIAGVTNYTTEVNLFPRAYFLAMNREAYEALHPDARALLDTFCERADSVYYAGLHLAAQAGARAGVAGSRTIYVLPDPERENWKTASAGVAPAWIDDVTDLGFDGQGFYDRALELIAEMP